MSTAISANRLELLQVADAVARGVREGARIDLVDDGAAPPFGTGGCDLLKLCHATRLVQTLTLAPE